MVEFDSENNLFENEDTQPDQNLSLDQDLVMDRIIENINTTPIGQVLKKIAALPEVRKEKVMDVRQKLTSGKYDLSDKLDAALDRVLEDLIA